VVYVGYVSEWFRDVVEPIVEYVNVHVYPRFHGDIPIYFYSSDDLDEVVRLSVVRFCGSPVSDECLEEYRRLLVETMKSVIGVYVYTGRFIVINWDKLRYYSRFGQLYVVFEEVLHGVFVGSGSSDVYVRLFLERYPSYSELIRVLRGRGFDRGVSEVVDAIHFLMNELYAVSGLATFLVALRRDCFEDTRILRNYFVKDNSLWFALWSFNGVIGYYSFVVGVEVHKLNISDLVSLYPSVCRDLKGVFVRFPVDTYEFWSRRFDLFDGIESFRRRFED